MTNIINDYCEKCDHKGFIMIDYGIFGGWGSEPCPHCNPDKNEEEDNGS